MSTEIQKYVEPLNANELGFLAQKEARERKVYFKIFRILMIFSFGGPFIGSWYRAYEGAANAFSYSKFFFSTGVLLAISSLATYISYRFNLRKIQKDLKYKTKTVDLHHITKKLFVQQNNTYYFFLDSHIRLSIEVSAADYALLKEGDEVSIEYATCSREYPGYF